MAADFELRSPTRNRRLFINISRIEQLTRNYIRRGFFLLGRDLGATANAEILRQPKSGRVYIRRDRAGRRRRHVASAPGETHANMTGDLRRSLGWRVRGHLSLEFGYGVGGDGVGLRGAPEYAAAIEFGSRTLLARPSLRNAINSVNRNGEIYFSRPFDPNTSNQIRRGIPFN